MEKISQEYTLLGRIENFSDIIRPLKRGAEYIQVLEQPETYRGYGTIDTLTVIRVTTFTEEKQKEILSLFPVKAVKGYWKGGVTLGYNSYEGEINPDSVTIEPYIFGGKEVDSFWWKDVLYRNTKKGIMFFSPATEYLA